MADIFALTEEEIALLDGFKEKSVHNLSESIKKARKTTLPRLIFSLGIPYVGEGIAEELAQQAGDIDTLATMTYEQFIEIEGIGEKVAESLVSYFQNPSHLQEIKRLQHLGVTCEKITIQKGHPFFGKTFVLTGTLHHFSRSEAANLIKERGGKVGNTVTKKTDYVLVGDDPGSKYEKAQALHVPILTEEAFKELL